MWVRASCYPGGWHALVRHQQNVRFPLTFWLIPPCHQQLPSQPRLLCPSQITRGRRSELFTSRWLCRVSIVAALQKNLTATFSQRLRRHIKLQLSVEVHCSMAAQALALLPAQRESWLAGRGMGFNLCSSCWVWTHVDGAAVEEGTGGQLQQDQCSSSGRTSFEAVLCSFLGCCKRSERA